MVVVAVVAVVALLVVALVARQGQVAAHSAYAQVSEVERQVRETLLARVSTLENRVDARSWAEFADLQSVPDELTKVGWAEQAHTQPHPAFQAAAQGYRDDGSDLEPESYEQGPIVG